MDGEVEVGSRGLAELADRVSDLNRVSEVTHPGLGIRLTHHHASDDKGTVMRWEAELLGELDRTFGEREPRGRFISLVAQECENGNQA